MGKKNTVIKQSVIKPTFCKFCNSTYQARHQNLEFWDMLAGRFSDDPKTPWSRCPLCKKFNIVEFEQPDIKKEKMKNE